MGGGGAEALSALATAGAPVGTSTFEVARREAPREASAVTEYVCFAPGCGARST